MPKDEHVAVLARGAVAWNAWRVGRDEAPDLSQAALRGLDLTGFDLSRADLRGADLEERHSVMRSCQAPIWRVRISSKRYSMVPTLPGRTWMERSF
jgi:hypothetical protein